MLLHGRIVEMSIGGKQKGGDLAYSFALGPDLSIMNISVLQVFYGFNDTF